jgi:hypothetical protein
MKKEEKIKQIIADKIIGKITPEHTTEGHFYRFKGCSTLVPSVTTITGRIINKPHLIRWAIKMAIEWLEVDERWKYLSVPGVRNNYIQAAQEAHTDIRDEAGHVGTTAHNVIEKYIKVWLKTGVKPKDIREFFPMVEGRITSDYRAVASARALQAMLEKNRIIPIASEILVGNPKLSAGTLDFLCLWDQKLCLVDFKTSNSIDPAGYSLQTSAYKHFFQEMTGLKIHTVRIVHLSKDYDKFDLYKVKAPAKAYKAFKNLVYLDCWIYNGLDKVEKDIKRVTL